MSILKKVLLVFLFTPVSLILAIGIGYWRLQKKRHDKTSS
jgi:CHASE3 domain sensor protein